MFKLKAEKLRKEKLKKKVPLYKGAPLYISKKDRVLMKEMKKKPKRINKALALITQNKKRSLVEAYGTTKGNVTDACRSANVARRTFYDWIEKDSVFAEAIVEADQDLRYEVRSALVQKIAEGNIAAIIFWLKCRDPEFQEQKSTFGVQMDKDGIKIIVTRGE